MAHERSPFLIGALAWVYDGNAPAARPTCGWNWSVSCDDALDAIAYLWHLTDLARSWAERWVQVRAMPGSLLVGWDLDVLAEARSYRALPTAAAEWAIRDAVLSFVAQCDRVDLDATFEHGDWGQGSVADGIRWLGHEFVHHQLDVDERAVV